MVYLSEAQRTALETPPDGGQPGLNMGRDPWSMDKGSRTHVCYSSGLGAGNTSPHLPIVSSPGGQWQ